MAKGKKSAQRSNKVSDATFKGTAASQTEMKENKPQTKDGEGKLQSVLQCSRSPGKKSAQRSNKMSDATFKGTTASQTETKENKPQTKGGEGKLQSVLQCSRSPGKARSPLSNSSTTLIQDGNDIDSTVTNLSELKQEIPQKYKPESCKPKEQNPDVSCQSGGTKQQEFEQHLQKESTAQSEVKPAPETKEPASRLQSKGGRKRGKKAENKAPQNRKVTDYFPIRRSNRKTETELKSEEHKHIDDMIKNGTEEGLEVKHIEGKGRGVFALKAFRKGDYVVEYHGDLLDLDEAKVREGRYAEDPETGCYMYYFQYRSRSYCIDATRETGRLGRLLNHSKTGNCHTRLHPINGTPHLILVASRDIKAEEELLYDYGDRSKASISAHPWLKH